MAQYRYHEWDGREFAGLEAEELYDAVSEFLLEGGERILQQLEWSAQDDELQELLEKLLREGYLERDESGRLIVSPKGLRRTEQRALEELFQRMARGPAGKHSTDFRGPGEPLHEESRPYQYGDPLANLNLPETMRNAVARTGPRVPIELSPDDFVVYETQYQTTCATVVLLDLSGSMGRFGKLYQAKKTALALRSLIRSSYPGDTVHFVAFYSYASRLTERELLTCTAKPVTLFDDRVFLRVDLDAPPAFVPEHFTNIHAGLRIARALLRRSGSPNKQIILITDGEPTAHIEGRQLYLIYPPSRRTLRYTLAEAKKCVDEGIHISTFAIVQDYFYFDLFNFVRELARLTQGVAIHCSAEELGPLVLESYQQGRYRRRMFR